MEVFILLLFDCGLQDTQETKLEKVTGEIYFGGNMALIYSDVFSTVRK